MARRHFRLVAPALIIAILTIAVGAMTPTSGIAQAGIPSVTDIQVRDGANPGEVVISWDAVPQAARYRVGYVNMEVDYHLAKATCTEEWIDAFVFVDVNARNIPVNIH